MGDFQQISVNDFRSVHSTTHYRAGYSHLLKGSLGTSYLSHLLGVGRILGEDINTVCCLDCSCETQVF